MSSHNHGHVQDHIDADLGPLYEQEWTQKLLQQTQDFIQSNTNWIGIDPSKPQRILDYACGNGIVSSATFQGIDLATAQAQRYNNEAAKLLGSTHAQCMFAIQGDLNDPSPVLSEPQWTGFDAAVISMALHHVKDPVGYLKQLRQRIRPGGVLVVIDFLRTSCECKDHAGHHAGQGGEGEHKYNAEDMIQTPQGHKIWSGFSLDGIKSDLTAAGCDGVDVRVYSEPIEIPHETPGFDKMFIAKATVV